MLGFMAGRGPDSLRRARFVVVVLGGSLNACGGQPAPAPEQPSGAVVEAWAASERARTLDADSAAALASRLANEACARSFGVEPFSPTDWTAKRAGQQWHWGQRRPRSGGSYSAEVSFLLDGTQPNVEVFWYADGSQTEL